MSLPMIPFNIYQIRHRQNSSNSNVTWATHACKRAGTYSQCPAQGWPREEIFGTVVLMIMMPSLLNGRTGGYVLRERHGHLGVAAGVAHARFTVRSVHGDLLQGILCDEGIYLNDQLNKAVTQQVADTLV
jgi:hypothetical protein